MKSKWFEYKDKALELRKAGTSMTVIERQLGIPRSTLSGWFKGVKLTEEQRVSLMMNKQDGWLKARKNAVLSHRAAKEYRLLIAKKEAIKTLGEIELTNSVLDLAFAMLYFGEGAKGDSTSLASSDPVILRFMLTVLKRNYNITPNMVRCDLHLRMDQDANELKEYWSNELRVPIERFKYVAYDKRSTGRATYERYKGVCVIYCGNIAIQRKLIYLYTLFCEKIAELDMGA
jgi:hypothetical protein